MDKDDAPQTPFRAVYKNGIEIVVVNPEYFNLNKIEKKTVLSELSKWINKQEELINESN